MTYAGQLTAEHLAEVHRVRDEWMAIGLSVQRCDRSAAERAVAAAYAVAGLEPPAIKIWMDSPLGGALALATLRRGDQLRGQLWGQLRGQLGDQLWGQLRGQLRGQLGDQLRGQLGDQLWGQLGDQLWGQLRDQLWDQLRGQLWGQLGPWADAYWISVYQMALSIAGLPSNARLERLADVDRQAGVWWPLQGAVVLTDRPTKLARDPLGRLHAGDGPALAYADGWELFFWHGRAVPRWVIQSPDAEKIAVEPNVEIRRCAIESLGWETFIRDANLVPVASSGDPGNPGQDLTLYNVPARLWGEPVRLLMCVNGTVERDGTRRRYGLTVPAGIPDPVSAAAWTYGITLDAYTQLEARR